LSRLEKSEEVSYTNPVLIVKVREKLAEFLSSILETIDYEAHTESDTINVE